LVQYCKILANKGDFSVACQELVKYGPPQEQSNFKLYKVISDDLLKSKAAEAPSMLRDMLLRLMQPNLSTPLTPKALAEDRSPQAAEFFKSLMAAQLQTNRQRLKDLGKAPELVAKISVSLCRYCSEFPFDKAFYDAGLDCKSASMINMSFFFLNRFLDIADAIEDAENAAIDNTDFIDTDIPSPYDLDLPDAPCVGSQSIEEIRDWVLGWSMDQNVQQRMDTRQCDGCRAEIYSASLNCNQCKMKYQPCAVTGFPVVKRSKVECTSCKVQANRDDWNFWVQTYKACPWCGTPQNAQF
jgi:intraflagellar transport protein 172